MPSSRGSSQPRDWTEVSCIAGSFFTIWATREAPKSNYMHPYKRQIMRWYRHRAVSFVKTKQKLEFHGHSQGMPAAAAKSLQSCPTLCDPTDGSPPGSPNLGFSRQEHWSGLPFPSPMHESEKWKWKVKVKSLSRVWLLATSWTAAQQAPPSMGFSRQEYWSGVPLPSPKECLEAPQAGKGKERFPLRASRGSVALQIPWFWILASRTLR